MSKKHIYRALASMFVPAFLLFNPMSAISQPVNRSPSEQEKHLRETTKQRGFDELVQAISNRDEGNYNLVIGYGLTPFGIQDSSLEMKRLVQDYRVRKLYQILDAMDEGEAAEVFRKKLSELKKPTNRTQLDEAFSYGLHAACFLAFEFGERKEFNRLFDDWNQWFRNQLKTNPRRTTKEFSKYSFDRTRGPELMMYLNLCLIEKMRQGKTLDEASSEISEWAKDFRVPYPMNKYVYMRKMLPSKRMISRRSPSSKSPCTHSGAGSIRSTRLSVCDCCYAQKTLSIRQTFLKGSNRASTNWSTKQLNC